MKTAEEQTLMQNKPLTGVEKAAVLLLTLDEDTAASILKNFNEREIEQVTGCISRLSNISDRWVSRVQEEFIVRFQGKPSLGTSESREKIKAILDKFLTPEQTAKYMESIMYGEDLTQGFEALKYIDPQTIASFIETEHPQTIALILAHLDVQKAAQVLPLLPREKQSDILMRIANIERVSPHVVKEIQEVIVHEILATGTSKSRLVGGAAAVADLMNNLDGQSVQQIFGELEGVDAAFTDEIRQLMFVFDDLLGIDDRALQSIIKEVTNDVLTLAIKTASDELKEKIYRNISSRAAELIKEELEVMGPVKLSDVERAQQEIVGIARRLEEEGKIVLGGKGGGELLV